MKDKMLQRGLIHEKKTGPSSCGNLCITLTGKLWSFVTVWTCPYSILFVHRIPKKTEVIKSYISLPGFHTQKNSLSLCMCILYLYGHMHTLQFFIFYNFVMNWVSSTLWETFSFNFREGENGLRRSLAWRAKE